MAARSKVELLPDAVRTELEQRLIASSFSNYQALADWLQEQGFEIHKAAVHRFGQKFEDRIRALKVATDQARAIVEASPDEDNALNEALVRMAQEKAFNLLVDMEVDPDKIDFPKLMRSVADLGRSSVLQKRFAVEAAERMQRDLKALEKEGFDKATLEKVSSRISIYLPSNSR